MTTPAVRNSSAWSTGVGDSVTLPQPLVGSVINVFGAAFSSLSGVTITDTAGNTYTYQAQVQDANGNFIALFRAPVTAAGSGTLTITPSGSGIQANEVANDSGIDGSLATGTYNSSAGGLASTSAITTTGAGLILSGLIDQNGAAITANTGTLIASTSAFDTAISQQQTTSSSGSYVSSFNVPAGAGQTAAVIAIAIKGSGGGGPSVAVRTANYFRRRRLM